MCKSYTGELTKHLCLQVVMYVFQVLARTVGRRRHDAYTLLLFEILGIFIYVFDMKHGINVIG